MGDLPPICLYFSLTFGPRNRDISRANSFCPAGMPKISWSLNRLNKKGSIASSESGPAGLRCGTHALRSGFLYRVSLLTAQPNHLGGVAAAELAECGGAEMDLVAFVVQAL